MRRTVPAIAALGLGLALTLTGCFANPLDQLTEGLVEGGVEQIIEDQTGVDVDIDGSGGASLPADWPSDVPTAAGEVVLSTTASGTYSAIINVASYDDVQRAFDEMLLAGFAEISTLDLGEGAVTRVYENTTWNVAVLGAQNDDGTATMQYTITPVSQ
jgi:hypothetical protein